MSTSSKKSIGVAGLAACAAAAGMLLLGAGVASAATPPYEPDPASVGTITFYNSAGNVITSGPTTTSPFAAYAVGSVSPRAGDPQAQLLFANPDPGSTPPFWYKEAVGSYTQLPVTTGPAVIQTASQTKPVVKVGNTDQTVQGFEDDSTLSTTAGYAGNVQVRLRTATGAGTTTTTYDVADIHVNGDGTWTQVYPAPKTVTGTTLTASPNPATAGASVTLTATEAPAVAGSVQFQDGSSNIGSPVAVNASGVATASTTSLSTGPHTLNAVFTPTDTTANTGSTGTTTETIQAPATPTTTTLSANQDGTAGDAATLTATVTGPGTSPNNAGTVSFYDGSSTTPLNGTPVSGTNGVYTLSLPTGFAAGTHSIVAKFTPTDTTQFNASQSAPATFTTQPKAVGDCDPANGSSCTDSDQNITVTIPNGSLTITTPYTTGNALNLGTATLDANNTQYSAVATFRNIKVTDTRAGGKGYTVSAQSLPLTDGTGHTNGTINAQNVGLTGLSSVGSAGFLGTVTPMDNPAANPAVGPSATGNQGLGGAPHTVLTVTNGIGTVTANGLLTINAPTSTEAGIFTGTITFTVA